MAIRFAPGPKRQLQHLCAVGLMSASCALQLDQMGAEAATQSIQPRAGGGNVFTNAAWACAVAVQTHTVRYTYRNTHSLCARSVSKNGARTLVLEALQETVCVCVWRGLQTWQTQTLQEQSA